MINFSNTNKKKKPVKKLRPEGRFSFNELFFFYLAFMLLLFISSSRKLYSIKPQGMINNLQGCTIVHNSLDRVTHDTDRYYLHSLNGFLQGETCVHPEIQKHRRIKCLEVTCLAHPYFLARGCLENATIFKKAWATEKQMLAFCLIWILPGRLSKQPISQGVATFHGLQEKRQKSCWLGEAWMHCNCAFPTLLKKPFCQVLFQRSGNYIKRHFSGTESSLWTWVFWHFHLLLLKQTHDQCLSVQHLAGAFSLLNHERKLW